MLTPVPLCQSCLEKMELEHKELYPSVVYDLKGQDNSHR